MATISIDAKYSDNQQNNNGNFTVDSGAVFTIDQSTADLRYVRCTSFGEVKVVNESTTQPFIVSLGSTGSAPSWRFEAGGISTIEGEWISLGTGNGTAGQVFNVPLAQGVNGTGTQSCPDLGGLFIDGTDTLRDGTSIPRLALQVDDDGYTNATDHEYGGNVFKQDTSANTVTFKRAIPSGQNVYMANIIFKTGASFTGSSFNWDMANSGTFIADKCHWSGDFYFNGSNAKEAKIDNTTFKSDIAVSGLFLTNQIEAPITNNIIVNVLDDIGFNVSNSAVAGTHKNIWVDVKNQGNSSNAVAIGTTSNATIEQLVLTNYNTGTLNMIPQTSKTGLTSSSLNTIINDYYCFVPINPLLLSAGSSGTVIDNVRFQFGCREDLSQNISVNALRVQNTSNITITNYHQIKADPIYSNATALTLVAGSSNITVDNVLIKSGAASSGNNRWDNIVNDNGNSNRYNNIIVEGYTKDRAIQTNVNSLNASVTNLYFIEQQLESGAMNTVGARCRQEQVYLNNTQDLNNGNFDSGAQGTGVDSLSVMGIRNTANGGAVEKTDGMFQLRMSPTSEQTDYYTEVTKTGIVVFNNNNRLYIQNANDVIELESFVHNNVSSITSGVTKRGNGVSSYNVTVKMRRPDGTYTSYVAANQSDMQTAYASLASDTLNRVQFKFRIEKNATNLTDYLQSLSIDCSLTGDDYPFSLYLPSTLRLTGLQNNSEVRIYQSGTTTELAGIENSSNTFDYQYVHDRTTNPIVDIVVHSLGFEYLRINNLELGINDSTLPIQQRTDRNYSNP